MALSFLVVSQMENNLSAKRLSLCMITKNEVAMLPDMLASVAGLWDELIVADTGSTDGTIALLQEHGATIVQHTWRDDFAAARNASLKPATGDWILFLDADERASSALCQQITALLKDEQAGAATVVMQNELPGGGHREAKLLRLFRNDPDIRFHHRIHEDVLQDLESFLAQEHLVVRQLSGVVQHLGYVRHIAAEKNKRKRDQELLHNVLQDDPRDFYCWFKLLESARYWRDTTLWQTVASEVEPLLMGDLSPVELEILRRNPWSGELAALISCGRLATPVESLAWLQQTKDRINPAAAWHLQLGLWLEQLDRGPEALTALTACLADERLGASHHHVRALLASSRLVASSGDIDRAMQLAQQALTVAPNDQEAILAIVSFAGLDNEVLILTDFVEQQVAAHAATASTWAEQLITNGKLELAASLLESRSGQEPALAMGHLVCALAMGDDFELRVELSAEKAEQALRHWVRVLWRSRQISAMSTFADKCGSVLALFPWLSNFLAAETAQLKGEHKTK